MAILSCTIVLVRPRDPNNIGAAARAMKNFGFTDLVVVAPHPPVWREARAAVGAQDVLARARVVETLDEAIAQSTLVVGTADPTRLNNIQSLFTPRLLRQQVVESNQRLALLFGPEKTGLTNADRSFCHRMLSIPTRPRCPSVNLGQAVAICCYELARDEATDQRTEIGLPDAASVGELEGLLNQAVGILKAAEFFSPHNQQAMTEELRRCLLQQRLTSREVTILRGALRQIAWKLRMTDEQ
jgi:tRNA/rRNA methyltransferase